MVCYVEHVTKLWSYTASRNMIVILGRFMEVARPILNPRLLLVIWVIWNTLDLFVEQKTNSMCFVTETRILFVCLEDISGSLTSDLRGKRFIVCVDYIWTIRLVKDEEFTGSSLFLILQSSPCLTGIFLIKSFDRTLLLKTLNFMMFCQRTAVI
jgi:hypothetical protein